MSTATGGLDAFERLVYARYACGRFDPNRPVPDELLTRLCVLTQVSCRGGGHLPSCAWVPKHALGCWPVAGWQPSADNQPDADALTPPTHSPPTLPRRRSARRRATTSNRTTWCW
jgi:hypothetical protein